MAWADTVKSCAPNVAQVTIERIIDHEGGWDWLALNVNKLRGPQPHASTAAEAAKIARRYIAMGFSVDLGAMQINSKNLAGFGYTYDQIEQVFPVCTNLMLGSSILRSAYGRARANGHEAGQPALKAALSIYNTGNDTLGFQNGYVARYYGSVPALNPTTSSAMVLPVQHRVTAVPAKPRNLYAADGQVWSD